MRSVKLTAKTEEPAEAFWDLIMDVPNWTHLIKFVKFIKIFGDVKQGAKFFDVTAIMWIPAIVHHKITKIEKNKTFKMEAEMPFKSGKMFQTIEVEKRGKLNYISIEIKFYISFFLFDKAIGPILELRLKEMLSGTLLKLKQDLEAKDKKLGISRMSEIINE
jgi:hypothetical protein